MAILKNGLEFSGGLGNLSAYKLPGMKQTIVRAKGGADKKKILNSALVQKWVEVSAGLCWL